MTGLGVGLLGALLAVEAQAPPSAVDKSCGWSSVGRAIDPGLPLNAVSSPHSKKGVFARPRANPGERFHLEGPWIVGAVLDAQGKVADARLLKSASDPPWPRYEAELLKGVHKWTFKPALHDGKPIPYCLTIELTDR